ncbi:MAG: hypothetical protein LBN99_04295 [Oscillospiraceae bacterium]|nr:hypothetical protein [Oscillospiraceae bacterium]
MPDTSDIQSIAKRLANSAQRFCYAPLLSAAEEFINSKSKKEQIDELEKGYREELNDHISNQFNAASYLNREITQQRIDALKETAIKIETLGKSQEKLFNVRVDIVEELAPAYARTIQDTDRREYVISVSAQAEPGEVFQRVAHEIGHIILGVGSTEEAANGFVAAIIAEFGAG